MIRNHLPSGDHLNPLTSVGKDVAFDGSPPARSTIQICEVPSRFERNATRRPSGENAGSELRLSPVVSRRGAPLRAGAIQTAERVRFSAMTGVPTA